MADELEHAVARHYGVAGIEEKLLAALRSAGVDTDRLGHQDTAAVDEFHVGGRAATAHVVSKMALGADSHVLDVGCGIGGASRFIAATTGAKVTGIDLTPEYVAAAQALTARTQLSERISYRVASALELPFPDATFDAAITLHVAMNIKDRPRLYREVARVLEPGATFAIYDIMQGDKDGLAYPVPWADTPATSHLVRPREMETLLRDAGFVVADSEDRTAQGISFFRDRFAAAAAGAPPALGTQVFIGPTAGEKFRNLAAGLESGSVVAIVMIARRGA